MKLNEIRNELFRLQDTEYGAFQAKLIPTIPAESVIGVRTPELKQLAKSIYNSGAEEYDEFLHALPHKYFEENQLHAFIISLEKDFETCVSALETFLPYIDNWATCDQLSPKVFAKAPERLLPFIESWLKSEHPYIIRFGIGMLMRHFLGENFRPEYPEKVANIRSDEYYINMMIAWYFATALAKQYDAVLPYLEQRRLDPWTHNKTIQKSIESYRIAAAQKAHLRTLKTK